MCPCRFAVVQTFTVFYAPVETADIAERKLFYLHSKQYQSLAHVASLPCATELPEVELNFIGDTPIVTGNDVTVQLSVSPSLPLLCEMITRGDQPRMPDFLETINCESIGKAQAVRTIYVTNCRYKWKCNLC